MIRLLFLYLHTVRYLTNKQILYRVYYKLYSQFSFLNIYNFESINLPVHISSEISFPLKNTGWISIQTFCFLNIKHEFQKSINWNLFDHGKLWVYHLNYFEYLLDKSCSEEEAYSLMHTYKNAESSMIIGKEPYPVSLRIFNWIKVMIRFQRFDVDLLAFVRCDLKHLSKNIEYHILGNHLLENAFALVFGGIAIKEDKYFNQGLAILNEQLPEQILQDGGHFERSPMYQQILLERILDCLNVAHQSKFGAHCVDLFLPYIKKMFNWLQSLTFTNGKIALFNDATYDMSMSTSSLVSYASDLGIVLTDQYFFLKESGYRRFNIGPFECIVDAGNLGPDYLLAHAHSDTLSFCLHYRGVPVIVDPGTSTYELGLIRQWERSTEAHNTVTVNFVDQSEVWSSFRVARRANAKILEEGDCHLKATHDGYAKINASHIRSFFFLETLIKIQDEVLGGRIHQAYLHFAPGIDPIIHDYENILADRLLIKLSGAFSVEKLLYNCASGFNKREKAYRLKITFNGNLITEISES